ncbi:ATP-binding cassette domain-containing protein [Sporosalibacterium faouarense]|uniref:ATP-binding cassette domain-containing protein n=1 Tax=Sporosalibacterium faouarense TaxID=516123 RepID=UPI00192C6525|nr:ATP-binding cassette domain-containing protein [Sporosalibacterium faouarense]
MIDYIIETENLCKQYKDVLAVNKMNLYVNKGELFGLVGPDGAGKTTTIQMLCSILNPTSGTAKILKLDTIKDAEKIKGKIGYMSEGFSLYGSLTVDENIEFFADLYKVPFEQRQSRKKKLLHFSRLTPFVDRPSEKLSGGMKKKLALCCTLMYSPEILFLDEPTLGVDPVSRREFWKILNDFRKEGITIFVTTPYMDEAERCDRVALLHRGDIIRCDSPSNLRRGLRGEMLDIKALPQKKAWNILNNIDEVLEAQIFGERIHVYVDELNSATNQINKKFFNEGIETIDLRKGVPSLEDVFVSAIQKNTKGIYVESEIELTNKINSPKQIKSKKINEIAIHTDNLVKKFGDFTAVNNLTMTVNAGEIFGFLGPNGSGKSTTIKMLTGLLMPTDGNAKVGGYDAKKEVGKLKAKIGYMSQKFSLYNDLTVEENINFYGGVYGVEGDYLKKRKNWVLNMAGLVGKEDTLTKSLSGGWKQRLALGCAILHEPSIIFLDEPTSGVDPVARRHFWDLIYNLSSEGITVFVTTHYMDEAEHCHNLGFIYNGNLIALGSPSDLKKEKFKGELLEIECNNPFRAMEILQNGSKKYQVSTFGNKLHVIVEDIDREIIKIEDILKDNRFQVDRLEEVPISLEDLFVLLIEEDDRKNRMV